MKYHVELLSVPEWLYRILKILHSKYMYSIPEGKEKFIEYLIANGEMESAKSHIRNVEKVYGTSTFTTKYTTRIDRIEILGK